jgi:predicted ATPase
MKRFILTGAPGAGKTSILRVLAATGYPVVDEAATDVNLARLAAGDALHQRPGAARAAARSGARPAQQVSAWTTGPMRRAIVATG